MKPPPIDYDTVREMLRTATPDRVLRFIGKSHPADIALLFKGLDWAEVRQLFDVLFSSRRAAKTLNERPHALLPDILAMIDNEKVGRLRAAVIPRLLKAPKFAPALGSGIIVPGLTDAFGFLSFLGLATWFRSYLI